MSNQRIHLFDLVSDLTEGHENQLFTVVGRLRVGQLEEVGGIWKLKNFCTGEEHDMIGNYIRVWKAEKFEPVW